MTFSQRLVILLGVTLIFGYARGEVEEMFFARLILVLIPAVIGWEILGIMIRHFKGRTRYRAEEAGEGGKIVFGDEKSS